MRIKLQALTEHIHGFLLILGITAFLSCLIFPSHYLFYFFHSFLLLIPFAVTAYGQEKIKHFVSYFIIGIACAILLFFIGSNFWEKLYFLIFSVAIMLIRIPSRLQKTSRGYCAQSLRPTSDKMYRRYTKHNNGKPMQ